MIWLNPALKRHEVQHLLEGNLHLALAAAPLWRMPGLHRLASGYHLKELLAPPLGPAILRVALLLQQWFLNPY